MIMGFAAVCGTAVLGALGGAVLPLPAYRLSVPWRRAGDPVVPPRDACAHCEAALPSGAAGWLRLGSRCASCRTRLGPPGWLLAGVCALACAGLGWRFGLVPVLAPYLVMALLGVLIATVDLATQRIPDVLVLLGCVVAVPLFALLALVGGDWRPFGLALLGGIALLVGYTALGLIPGANLGGGDIVLAGLLGIHLGWLGWRVAFLGALLPWLVQAPVALVALATGRAGGKTMLPFGPAMVAGAYLAILGPAAITALLTALLTR